MYVGGNLQHSSCCGTYIFLNIIHQHLMAAVGREPAHFSPPLQCTRSVTSRGVERMSWRRYVFLHRIHPHSILIGFALVHRIKKKKGKKEKERANRGERRDESFRGRGTCCSGFPSSPSQLCHLVAAAFMQSLTSIRVDLCSPFVVLCGATMCLY